jgi:tetratricopeptide (TPR) repeat protein
MNTLAVAYEGAGKAGRALPLYEKLFEFAKAKMGPKHPTTLVSMFNLASAYEGIGNSEQAVVLLKQTLQLRRAILGEEHHETLRTLQKLANVYANAERRSEAISSCQEALKILTVKLGRDHRDTLFAMNELAYAYYWGQEREKMLPLAEEALKLSKAKLEPDDETTLVAMNNLGLAYLDSGNLKQAIGLFEEALQLSQEKRGPSHARTVTSRHNLGLALADARQWKQAIPLLEDAVRSRKADIGLDNRLTLNATRRLAMAYRDSGDLDRALTLFEELLTLNLAARPRHEETLRTRQGLGKTLILIAERPDTAEAERSRALRRGEKLMREHLAGARSLYTNDPVALASSTADLAEFRYRRGDYAEAEGLYRETIKLRRTKLNVEHKDVIDATASLARLLSEWVWAEREGISDARAPRSGLADRAHEAERLLRDVLALRLRENTNSWRVGDVQSRLGGALVSVAIIDATLSPERRAATLTEAESLLLEGHARLQKQSNDEKYISDAARRLVHLYEAWKKSDKRSEWQNKLEGIEKAVARSTGTKPVTSASSRTGVETK